MLSLSPLPDPQPAPSWVRRLWNTPWLWLALIVPLFCAPLFVGLDGTNLENDEAIYSFAVDTMLKDGDWLTPKSIPSETSAFLEKPPLKFWITYVPMKLGLVPQDEAGMRVMDAAMSALAFLYVFGIGRKLAGPVCGLVAVLLLFSQHALLFTHGLRSNNMESSTVLVYAAGVYHFLAWRSLNPDVKRHVYAMALWFVAGFMTKFVAALFLPVVLGLAALIKREDRGRLYRDWPTFALAAFLAVALIAPWFLYQYVERGPRLFDIMFGAHVLKRFTAYLDPAHLHPWHYYFTEIWAELARNGTRALTAVASVLFVLQVWRRRWIEGLIVVLWFLIPVAVISAGTSKLYHYAYPYLAPLALASGWLAAAVASRLYLWLATPLGLFARARSRALPGVMSMAGLQITLTVAGSAAFVVALATAAFDRLQIALGGLSFRNSSVVRPLTAASILWFAAAPPQILGGAIVAVLLALTMPLAAYHANVTHTAAVRRDLHDLRGCLAPISGAELAAGRKARGTFVEASSLSFVPFYYLRTFGQWQQGGGDSLPAILKSLLSEREPQFVLISPDRYTEVVAELRSNRSAALERAAPLAGTDAGTLASRLEQESIGLVRIDGNVLLLPRPYAVCGHEQVRLTSNVPPSR